MMYDTATATALLARAPSVFRALVLDLPTEWLEAVEAPGAWSLRDVACHVADLERDGWLPRLQLLLAHGSDVVLPLIDRERFRTSYDGVAIERVLDDFDRLRQENLSALAELEMGQEQLKTIGRHHLLGEVRASQLLGTWVVHDLTHQSQIVRTLAAQYGDVVGPWREYLSVLRSRA